MKANIGQNIFDFLTQNAGGVDNAINFCKVNGISDINADLNQSTDYIIPTISNSKSVAFFSNSGIKVASNINHADYDSFSNDFSNDFS